MVAVDLGPPTHGCIMAIVSPVQKFYELYNRSVDITLSYERVINVHYSDVSR